MAIDAMSHFTVLTDDVPATVGFYRDVLGMADGPRPALGFPGAWLYARGQPILHVIGGRLRSELEPGVIDHMAFAASGLGATLAALDARRIEYTCRQQVGSGTWQVFFRDPNGAKVELDFAAAETAIA